MFRNIKSPEKNENHNFVERPNISNEIHDLFGNLPKQQKTMDNGSLCESISEISLSIPSNVRRFSTRRVQKESFPQENKSLLNNFNLNFIPFDKQKYRNSPFSLHSEPIFGDCHSDVKNRYAFSPSELIRNKNEGIQRYRHYERPIIHRTLEDKSTIVPIESNIKTIPFFSVSHNQLEKDLGDKLNNFENRKSLEVAPSHNLNIMCNTVLKNNKLSSESSLQSEDMFSAYGSSIFHSTKSLASVNKIFHDRCFYTGKQNPFSLNSMEFSKNNSFHQTYLNNANKFTNQHEEMKSNPLEVLNAAEIESKLISFNFSLQLENQRKIKDFGINFKLKASRKLSAPSNAGFINKADQSCLFEQIKCPARRCKSEVQIPYETKSMPEINFLDDKDLHSNSFSDMFSKNTTCEESPKLKHIPTFRGRRLPAKVSVLLLNGPIRMNYTEDISGESQEILMCTRHTIEDVTRNETKFNDREIVKSLLVKSRPYIGKPIHIIFEPKKIAESPSFEDPGGGFPVRLHPSRAMHNLLAENLATKDEEINNETDAGRCSDVTLVMKSNQLKEIENRMFNGDASGLESSAKQNNSLRTSICSGSTEPEAKPKFKIRLCRRKKCRTDLKRVNVKQIVSSVFGNFFHFYSLFGGHLRSGSVITKSNSILWFRQAGVATDARSKEIANEIFKNIAGAKLVLNIFDYMKFLITFARRQQIATVDLIKQLTICELPKESNIQKRQKPGKRRLKFFRESKHSKEENNNNSFEHRTQSLPNLKFCSTCNK